MISPLRRAFLLSDIFRYSKQNIHLCKAFREGCNSSSLIQNALRTNHNSRNFSIRNYSLAKGVSLSSVDDSNEGIFYLKFGDESRGATPYLWLRDNCQCPECFDPVALARTFLLEDLKLDVVPKSFNYDEDKLSVTWSDGHEGTYRSDWLYRRAFNPVMRDDIERLRRLEVKKWSKDFQIQKFDYGNLITNDTELLKWLVTMETDGTSLVKNVPSDPDAGAKLSDHIGQARNTHYGRTSSVYNRESANNLAFRSVKLGLHVDLPYYDYQPGLIILHMLEQHKGTGGESTVSDGFFCSDYLRQHYPEMFKLLTSRNVYFWDKGQPNLQTEKEFYKVGKHPIIKLGDNNEVVEVRYNNQVRDTFLEASVSEVNEFYRSLKKLDEVLQENSIKYRMEGGDMLILDNLRCLHGREGFETTSSRHLETSYIDWDELRCKRRRLEERLLHT